MQWLSKLSGRQKIWLVGVVVVALAIAAVGVLHSSREKAPPEITFTMDMTIQEAADSLEASRKAFAHELGLPMDVSKNKPIRTLGVTQEKFDHAIHHILSHRETALKYYLFGALVLFGLVFLVRLGRPDDSPTAERKIWYPRWPYLAALVLAVALCGFALGKSPNPMEGTVKVFKSMVGLYPSVVDKVVAFVFFAALAVIGTKLICGWACPFGALQELIYHLPILRKLKKRKLPFWISNSIRCLLFAIMVLLLFGIVGKGEGFVLYHFVNPFNLFNLDIETVSIGATIVAALVLSLGFYRPFCRFICPFGLLSWLLEQVSIFRIRIDRTRCTKCGACVRACPLNAAKGRLEGKLLPADCFSCARCLNVCPEDAISYGLVGGNAKSRPEETALDSDSPA